jgi:uncharacterized protein CbrC (UPF0167 family)
MKFNYFRDAKNFGGLMDTRCKCSVCGFKEKCFDGEAFYGETEVEAICFKCLKNGRLKGSGIFSNDADVEALFDQMLAQFPDKSKDELLAEAKEKIDEVELRTPPILSWEDWKFPALDGDFCEFISFTSKAELSELAEDGDGKAFLTKYLRVDEDNLVNPEIVWYQLSETKIEHINQTNHNCLCYLFQSKVSGEYLVIWDLI